MLSAEVALAFVPPCSDCIFACQMPLVSHLLVANAPDSSPQQVAEDTF